MLAMGESWEKDGEVLWRAMTSSAEVAVVPTERQPDRRANGPGRRRGDDAAVASGFEARRLPHREHA